MDSEFAFELYVCQWAERHWPPGGGDRSVIVARQLGTRRRRWDTIVVECDAEALAARASFGGARLDSDLLHVVRNAPETMTWYRDALPDPGYPWRYVREAVHRASDRGVVETRREGNRIHIRRTRPYPDWVDRIIAIENKPDLEASAATALKQQLENDVALALADEVWVATRRTGDRVEPALLEDIPVEAGILTMDPWDTVENGADVAWQARQLSVDEPGTRIIERPPAGSGIDAHEFEYAGPSWKRNKRLEIAERAYERGWRSYVETMRADCRYFDLRDTEGVPGPYCRAKDRRQTPSECSGSCPDFEPEPPHWRQRGWPIEGGPGAAVKRILERQRRRQRPDPSDERR